MVSPLHFRKLTKFLVLYLQLHSLSFFVLDEADRMIENGHFQELRSIIDLLPGTSGVTEKHFQDVQNCTTISNFQRKKRQTFVFSATIALSRDFRKKLKRGSLKSKHSATDGLSSLEALSERAGMKPDAAVFDLTSESIMTSNLEESFLEYVVFHIYYIYIYIHALYFICPHILHIQFKLGKWLTQWIF